MNPKLTKNESRAFINAWLNQLYRPSKVVPSCTMVFTAAAAERNILEVLKESSSMPTPFFKNTECSFVGMNSVNGCYCCQCIEIRLIANNGRGNILLGSVKHKMFYKK